MSHSSRTSELLVRWWNFTDAGVWGRALSARRVEDQSVDAAVAGQDDQLGLTQLIASRLEEFASETSSTKTTGESLHQDHGLKTFLDMWIESAFDQKGINEFATELYNPSSMYELVLESGKTFRAHLPLLCSIRIAEVLLKRPNPLFYFPPAAFRSGTEGHSCMVFDPRFLLPIAHASSYRRALLAADQIRVSRNHLFLFGNYFPELVGKAVLDSAPLAAAHARARQADSLLSGGNLTTGPSNEASREMVTVPIVRIFLLGFARLLKGLFSGSVRHANRSHRIISSLVGPWSSKPVLGRRDYLELKRLSRRGMVST